MKDKKMFWKMRIIICSIILTLTGYFITCLITKAIGMSVKQCFDWSCSLGACLGIITYIVMSIKLIRE